MKNTGIARTTGGSAGIAGGLLAGLGVILAPFTVGASLGLTVSGTVIGIGGAATSITAKFIKDAHLKDLTNDARNTGKTLEWKDQVIQGLMKQLKEIIEELRVQQEDQAVVEAIETIRLGKYNFELNI